MKEDSEDAPPLSDAAAGALQPEEAPLPESVQRRNSLVFLVNNSLSYVIAPVIYIGMLHAAIIKSLGFNNIVANLPEAAFIAMLPVPVVISWFWPSTRYLRPMLVSSYLLKAFAGIITAALFVLAPPIWRVIGIVAFSAIVGATNGVTNMCLWELIGRGMTPARRTWTLGITFGIGPICAVFGSCLSGWMLSGTFLNLVPLASLPRPWNYVVLFGLTGPTMIMAGAVVFVAHLPRESSAEPSANIAAITQGLRQYFTYRLILIAACGFLLTQIATAILPNLGLYVRDSMHKDPEMYSGVQLVIRFGCKSLVGFALGWLAARTYPKTPAIATTLISLAGICWVLLVPGKWYMLSIGMVGAGELFYIYYLNYIVGCSTPQRIRENIAYTNLLSGLAFMMPLVYGSISVRYGLRSSFELTGGILVVASLIVMLFLPRRPTPQAEVPASERKN